MTQRCGGVHTVLNNVAVNTTSHSCQKDTLVVEHHVDVAQLHRCHFGGALIQTGHCSVLVPVQAHHAVLQVQLILIARHGQLCTESDTSRKSAKPAQRTGAKCHQLKECSARLLQSVQTCDCALSDLEDSVSDGGSRQQVDVIRRAEHDVL